MTITMIGKPTAMMIYVEVKMMLSIEQVVPC